MPKEKSSHFLWNILWNIEKQLYNNIIFELPLNKIRSWEINIFPRLVNKNKINK